MDEDDQIPVVEIYRGCAIESGQSLERVKLVRCEIDRVAGMDDADALVLYAINPMHSPESRQLAAARAEALWELASAERRLRPSISLELLRAGVAGLGCRRWQNPLYHCSLLDPDGGIERERPLDDAE